MAREAASAATLRIGVEKKRLNHRLSLIGQIWICNSALLWQGVRGLDCTLVQLSDHRGDRGEKAGEEAEDGWAAEPSSTLNT